MRKVLFVAVLLVPVALSTAALAVENPIPWGGQGSENLPCENGGHWVLAPSFGIDSAILTVDGVEYPMTQNGEGSWSADSVGPIDENVDAFVTFTGEGDDKNHLQLSHCTGGQSESPSPSESESPSPSETETPTPSDSETPSESETPVGDRFPNRPTGTAFTGSDVGLLIGLAIALLIVGTLTIRYFAKEAGR